MTILNANEYITKGDVMQILQKAYTDGRIQAKDGCASALDDIGALKAADVQPVKHGHWETWGYVFHGIEWKRCSVCGKIADVSYRALLEGRIEPVMLSLCGCCGARMDGDTE